MQIYELAYLVLPSVPEKDLGNTVEKIKQAVTDNSGNIFDSEEPFKYPLSYTMSKTVGSKKYMVNEAYIGWMKFEIEVPKVLDVKAGVEKISEVLRLLLIKAPRKTEFTFAKAKALLKAKEDKDVKESEEEVVAPTLEEVGVPTDNVGKEVIM